MPAVDPFLHLESRCLSLLTRYIDPIIQAEADAVAKGLPLPDPDFDSLAAFRLLSHAELEGYFEAKAEIAIANLDTDFRAGDFKTTQFASLIFLYLWKQRREPQWTSSASKDNDDVDLKRLAQESLGYARQFIKENNGIKENSISTLSAMMGYFANDLDSILISELNQYGKNRGDVAHASWAHNTRTFEAATIEKNRLQTILSLTKQYYENSPPILVRTTTAATGFSQRIAKFFRPARSV